MIVPLVDVTRQHREIESDLKRSVLRVLDNGQYVLGEEVSTFEHEMAEYIGVACGIGVGSGTDALQLIIKALGIGIGDEVIVPAFTFVATAGAVANCGATPVFADIDPRTFNIDTDSAASLITPQTKAIIAVHLYGLPASVGALVRLAESSGIYLIEDCAQATGSEFNGRKVGSFGIASAFSFFPTKNLGCAGDGGMVCTNDHEVDEKIRRLRNHGLSESYKSERLGTNSRLDEIQAAILREKLKHIDKWNEERRAAASIYDENLRFVETPFAPDDLLHVYHQYTVRATARDLLAESLAKAGISNRVYYPIPLHLQPCFRELEIDSRSIPESEKAAGEVLSLPMFPGITDDEVEAVCQAVNRLD